MIRLSPERSAAAKLMSSTTFSNTVCRRRAPMFSTAPFTSTAASARASMASSVKVRVTFSVASSAWVWRIRLASGSVRMRRRSSRVSAFSSTRIGSLPCNSGSRSEGLATWKAPEAMNRMWSVFTGPYLVETVVPSISGSRSRCTPSRETSAPARSLRLATLSISSRKTMPVSSASATASLAAASWSTSFSLSSAISGFQAAATVVLCALVRPPKALPIISDRLSTPIDEPGWPGMSKPWNGVELSARVSSMSLSSSSPARSFLRKLSRVGGPAPGPTRASRIRSSAAPSALAVTPALRRSLIMPTAISTKSRTIWSTSRPT